MVELSVQVRQLAEWASEGALFRMRVAFVIWLDCVYKTKQARVERLRFEMLARKLDAVCTQTLFTVWRSVCVCEKTKSTVVAFAPHHEEDMDASNRLRSNAYAQATRPSALRRVLRRSEGCLRFLDHSWLRRLVFLACTLSFQLAQCVGIEK